MSSGPFRPEFPARCPQARRVGPVFGRGAVRQRAGYLSLSWPLLIIVSKPAARCAAPSRNEQLHGAKCLVIGPGPGRHVKAGKARHARPAPQSGRRLDLTSVALLILMAVQVVLTVVQVANLPGPSVVCHCNINISAGRDVDILGGDEAGDGHRRVARREPGCGSVWFSPQPTP